MNCEVEESWQKNFQVLAGGRSRTAEPWITGPWSYPLDHEGFVDRIILELPDIVWGQEYI
jgi:hypothetical protein